MPATTVTPEDLQVLKEDLLKEIAKMFTQRHTSSRRWLKSHEVRRLLTISPGTLQHLRITGKLPFTKIGGVIFYDYDDIETMIRDNKNNRDFPSPKNNPWRNI